MRTTLTLEDDVLAAARALAESEGRTVGEVVSELARRGLRTATAATEIREGFPVFSVPADAPPLTPNKVRAALDEDA